MTENCSVSTKAVVVIFSSYVGCQMGCCKGRAAVYCVAAAIAQPNRPIWVLTISLISQIFQTKTMDQLKMMPVSADLNHKKTIFLFYSFFSLFLKQKQPNNFDFKESFYPSLYLLSLYFKKRKTVKSNSWQS